MKNKLNIIIASIFLVSTIYMSKFYLGSIYIYLIFSFTSCLMIICGFRKNALFVDAFIAIFFILGFWLKFSIRMTFFNGEFHEAIGAFSHSSDAYDRVLLISSCGFSALIIASYFREFCLFNLLPNDSYGSSLEQIYKKYRYYILLLFLIIIFFVGVLNMKLGIYQKGEITQTNLPFRINGVIKWLLLFGLASLSTVFIKMEMKLNNSNLYLVSLLSIFEAFISSISMLSRGMILNTSAILFGMYLEAKLRLYKIQVKLIIIIFLFFSLLFFASVYTVNSLREYRVNILEFYSTETISKELNLDRAKPLIIDRWVGIEGVMAVSSYPNLGWDLLSKAWSEKYNENTIGFYDSELITSPYANTDFTKHHHISLPGLIAFLFYPGSYIFLFISIFIILLIGSFIEYMAYYLSDYNIIFCSLIGQVIAYRFASFGYVPSQSYLLFGSIFLNILIIYTIYKTISILRK